MDPKLKDLGLGLSMPVLNERHNLNLILPNIAKILAGANYTLCIVDDGSTDGTLELLRDLMAADKRIHLITRIKKLYGCQRGAASRAALEWLVANTAHAVFVDIDADGANNPEELLNGATYISTLGHDVAIASKYVYGSKVIGRTLSRKFVSRFYSTLARFLFNARIRDYSNSYRFYSRNAAELWLKFKPSYTSPVYLLEMLVTWIANDLDIIEIPTQYVERDAAKSKVKFVDLIKGFLGALDISLKYHRNYYRQKN